jgi:hypothetical protein
MMKRILLPLTLIFLLPLSYHAQSADVKSEAEEDLQLVKLWMVSDLQSLNTRALKLETPLARALAKAEIADAAWALDQAWAKKLLREAYEFTLPDEEEQLKLRKRPIGAPLTLPSKNEIARNLIRGRVLQIASREKTFASELVKSGGQRLGSTEEHNMYRTLAARSMAEGDNATAGTYVLNALEADPTLLNAGLIILEIATRDRKAADQLILQYIERLRRTTLSQSNDSAFRVYYLLENLVFPSEATIMMMKISPENRNSNTPSQQIPPAGTPVIKAYIGYVIESLNVMEQREPGSVMKLRGKLLSVWLPLKQYAPELAGAFFELEKLSRRPGENLSLPTQEAAEAKKDDYEKRLKEGLNSDSPDDLTINFAISRGDFDKARKMIDKLADGPQKSQLTETVNAREAISLATNGDIFGAQRLAEQLNKATSILQVYPVVLNKCVAKKDQACANALIYQAIKQLKRADTSPTIPPAGIPPSAVPSSQEFDPILLSLSKLAKVVAPINEMLALEVLDETIIAANRSQIDTGQGRVGLETDVFKKLVPKNEGRVRQAADNLKDPLRQIVALAVIYQWKAEELEKRAKANSSPPDQTTIRP